MKKVSILLAIASLPVFMQAGVIHLEGNYQGKNLYIQNPFAGTGVGFCVFEVRVNNQVTTDEIASSAFEVDFKNFQFKIGDKIEIDIKHKDDCRPKVLNPEVLKPRSTYELIEIKIDKDGTLKWKTKNESGKLPYIVEQFRWNKWVKVGEVEGNGTADPNDYQFKVTPHSGENQFRVKQVDYTNQPKPSKSVRYNPPVPEVESTPKYVTDKINFVTTGTTTPVETMYEIYDQYGNVVKKGFGSSVEVRNLTKGLYYLNFDNKMTEFMKKK